VLVDSLAPELINLRIYFWFNGREHSMLKVRSSLIRLVKRAFQEQGIRLPAAPGAGLAVGQLDALLGATPARPNESQSDSDTKPVRERRAVATQAEGRLESQEKELQSQADQARPPEGGDDLLNSSNAGHDGASTLFNAAAAGAALMAPARNGSEAKST
jgi:small conductance mechanosensitive channel